MKATDQFKALLPTIFEGLKPAFVQGRPEMAKEYDAIMPIIINGASQRLAAFADMLAGIYAQNFSVDELHDLTAFYRSPTGQKLIARQPVIARASMVAGQQFGQIAGGRSQRTDHRRTEKTRAEQVNSRAKTRMAGPAPATRDIKINNQPRITPRR